MSKSTVILNGENTNEVKEYISDANVNMVAAIKDNSCSKHLETFSTKDNKVGLLAYHCDFDHMYASSMSDSETFTDKNTEIVHLKELLLLHLDLIQQQSEQLVTKEKQICALKQENNMLKQRLERMDRRVNLQKHKEPSEGPVHSIQAASSAEIDQVSVITDLDILQQNETTMAPVTVDDSDHVVRRRKKDDKTSVSGSVCASVHKRRNRSLSWTSSVNSTDVPPASKVNGSKLIKREHHQRRERTRKKRPMKEGTSEKLDENIIMTENPYYTPVGDADNIWNVDEVPVGGCVLEVPSWRVKVFTSCYSMEGTENLCDDVFDRRHSRLEIDERRRKRWDVQRIREQRQLEKLRQGGRKRRRGTANEGELDSLWPTPEQAQYLEVQDALPVAAFGCPITKFNPADSEFTLPWVTGKDMSRSRPSYGSHKKR